MNLKRCELHLIQYDGAQCPHCEVDDDPFGVNDPIAERVHVVIGICCGCKGDGHTTVDWKVFCYPCAYDFVNW